jgi:hypothetical protein
MRSIVAWDSVLLLFLLLMHYPLHITSEISICRQTVCTCPSLILSTALPALQHPEITPKKDRDESRTRSCPSHCPDSTWNRPNHPPEDLCTLLLIAHVQLLSGYPSPQPVPSQTPSAYKWNLTPSAPSSSAPVSRTPYAPSSSSALPRMDREKDRDREISAALPELTIVVIDEVIIYIYSPALNRNLFSLTTPHL